MDYRKILQQSQILTANVVEQLSKKPLTVAIAKPNQSTIAVLNPSQL